MNNKNDYKVQFSKSDSVKASTKEEAIKVAKEISSKTGARATVYKTTQSASKGIRHKVVESWTVDKSIKDNKKAAAKTKNKKLSKRSNSRTSKFVN